MRVERLGLLHVAHMARLGDDRKLGGRYGGVQLLRDMQRTSTIIVIPQNQRGHATVSGVSNKCT